MKLAETLRAILADAPEHRKLRVWKETGSFRAEMEYDAECLRCVFDRYAARLLWAVVDDMLQAQTLWLTSELARALEAAGIQRPSEGGA